MSFESVTNGDDQSSTQHIADERDNELQSVTEVTTQKDTESPVQTGSGSLDEFASSDNVAVALENSGSQATESTQVPHHESVPVEEVNQGTSNAELLVSNDVASIGATLVSQLEHLSGKVDTNNEHTSSSENDVTDSLQTFNEKTETENATVSEKLATEENSSQAIEEPQAASVEPIAEQTHEPENNTIPKEVNEEKNPESLNHVEEDIILESVVSEEKKSTSIPDQQSEASNLTQLNSSVEAEVEQNVDTNTEQSHGQLEDEVDLEKEDLEVGESEPVPTFINEIQKEDESIPPVPETKAEEEAKDLSQVAEENNSVPTFLDEINHEEGKKEDKLTDTVETTQADVPTLLDNSKQDDPKKDDSESFEALKVPTFLDEINQGNSNETNPVEDSQVPTFLDEIKQGNSTEANPVEDSQVPAFLDEFKSENESIEKLEVPTFLDEVNQDNLNEENHEPIKEPEIPTFLDEIKQEEPQENVPSFLDEIQKLEEPVSEIKKSPEIDQTPADDGPNFLDEIKLEKLEEKVEEQKPQSALDAFVEDKLEVMPWDEVKEETKEDTKEDAFAFLEETAEENGAESEKSFSFLEDDFEPLLEEEEEEKQNQDEQSEKKVAPNAQRYLPQPPQPQPQPSKNAYIPQVQQPAAAGHQLPPSHQPALNHKKSFFEELPPVSTLSHTRLTTPAKTNPYALIVQQHSHQQPHPAQPPSQAPRVMLPPPNPYAPSAAALKQQQEHILQTPLIPQPTTAKDSLAHAPLQDFTQPHNANVRTVPPPRNSSRASSVASKSFFEELPVLKSPTTSLLPKNPYAPLVHQVHAKPPATSNPYGIAQISHRRMSSLGSSQFALPPQNKMAPPHNAYAPPPSTTQQTFQPPAAQYQGFANPPAVPGNRSRTSSYLPQSPNVLNLGFQPSHPQNLSPAIPPLAPYSAPPAKHSKYLPQVQANPVAPPPVSSGATSYAPPQMYSADPPVNTSYQPQPVGIPQPPQQSLPIGYTKSIPQQPPAHGYGSIPVQSQTQLGYSQVAKPPTSYPSQSNFNGYYNEQVDNFQVPADLEFSRQFPIFNFNRTKKVAKVIGNGTVDIVDFENYSTLDPLEKSFGPLSKSKTKKLTIEGWINDRIGKELTVSLPKNPHFNLTLIVLRELIKGDGQLKDSSAIIEELSKSVSIHFPNHGKPEFKPDLNLPRPSTGDNLGFGLFNYLNEGNKEDALQYVVSQKEWPISFILASLNGPQSVLSVMNQYLLETFAQDKSSTSYVLYFVLNILSGNSAGIINWIALDEGSFNFVLQNFNLILSLVLKNGTNLSPFYIEFGTLLVQKGYTLLGHILFVLSGAPLSEMEIKPGVSFSVVGANTATEPGFIHSIDVMILTEIYEHVLSLPATSAVPANGFPHLLSLKISHAALLADNGCPVAAQKYTDFSSAMLKSIGKTIRIDPNVVNELENLISRTSETGESGWFSGRPKLIGMLDKGFSKFIAGDEAAPKRTDSDGLFINYSPTISRTQSVADFGANNLSAARPAYAQTKSFIGLDNYSPSSAYERRGSNAPPKIGKYNPPLSAGMYGANATNGANTEYSPAAMYEYGQVAPVSAFNQTSQPTKQAQASPYAPVSASASVSGPSQPPAPAFHQPPQAENTFLTRSPSLRSEFNDDIADIRSSISKASNISRYAPLPSNLVPQSIVPPRNTEIPLPPRSEKNFYSGSHLASQASFVASPPVAKASLASELPPVSQIQSRRDSQSSQARSQVSPYLAKKTLSYSTPAHDQNLSQNFGNSPNLLAEESDSDIYRETPSKFGHKSAPNAAPVNPYAKVAANRIKKSNRYAPPPAVSESLSQPAADISLNEMTSGDIDIYSYGGYARPAPPPAPPVTEEKEPEPVALPEENEEPAQIDPEQDVLENSHFSPNFTPYEPPSFTPAAIETHTQAYSQEPSYAPPSDNFYSRSASVIQNDDDYDDDVVDDDDDDDDQEAIAAAAEAAAEAERKKKEEEEKKRRKKQEEEEKKHNAGKSGWFGGLFGGAKESGSKEDKKVYKAKLGEQSTFHYDEKLKRWVNGNSLEESETATPPPPPPPTVKVPKKASDTPLPPSAIAPPLKSGPSAPPTMSKLASPPPGRVGVQTPLQKSSKSGDIDDLLNMASATKSTGRSKRGPRHGYVDVMNQ